MVNGRDEGLFRRGRQTTDGEAFFYSVFSGDFNGNVDILTFVAPPSYGRSPKSARLKLFTSTKRLISSNTHNRFSLKHQQVMLCLPLFLYVESKR